MVQFGEEFVDVRDLQRHGIRGALSHIERVFNQQSAEERKFLIRQTVVPVSGGHFRSVDEKIPTTKNCQRVQKTRL